MSIHFLAAATQPFAPFFAAAVKRDPHYGIGFGFTLALMLVILGIILLCRFWWEKKRSRALGDVASTLGFEFLPKGDPVLQATLTRFPLCSAGRNRKLTNLMRRDSASFVLNIFDYSYVTGRGRSTRTWQQTVACLQSAALDVPNFVLAPKRFWDSVRGLFGKKTIELEHPVFSTQYVLHCNTEAAIRQLFSDDLQQFFADHRGMFSQGTNNQLLLFRSNKRVKPAEINAFVEDALKLLSVVHASSREPDPSTALV